MLLPARPALMMPPAARRSETATPSRSEASFISICRASAAACRIGMASFCMVLLALVVPWSGVREVSPITMVTRSRSTSSSSATIWASAVRMPVPRSTRPVKQVTPPSGLTASHESIRSFGIVLGQGPGGGSAARNVEESEQATSR
jgi:hypothetical protein